LRGRAETTDIEQLNSSGSWGSGDFASFLYGAFGIETTRISLLREEKSPTDLTALFGFDVPFDKGHYVYRSHGTGARRTIGYHGTFLVDERLAELKRLTVEADRFPVEEDMCRVEEAMDYRRVKIGDGDFLLPETSRMTILFNNGEESQNETRYSGCREYGAESTISFDDAALSPSSPDLRTSAQRTLPPNLRLEIGLKSPIRSETAAAGDAVTPPGCGRVHFPAAREPRARPEVPLRVGDPLSASISRSVSGRHVPIFSSPI